MRVDDVYQINIREVRLDPVMIRQIIKIGLPSGIQNSIISLANIVVQSNINAFGTAAMAGCGSYGKLEGFGFLPITCFTMALTTFVSQNLGAKEYERVKKGAAFGIGCTLLLAETVGLLIFTLAPHVIGIFGGGPDAIAYGVLQAKTVTLFYFLLAFSHASAAIMRGAGKSTVPMYVMLVSWCLIRISYITVVGTLFDNIQLIFMAYPITWTISSVIFLTYLLKGNWMYHFEKQEMKEYS
jgi:Na+-driven multidrug efflux pump